MNESGFLLGSVRAEPPTPLRVDPADFTTHGAVVGMTGSGKTGLLVSLAEEALLAGIPVVVVDPKGDLADLFLTFPDLAPESFLPWVDAEEARRRGITPQALAAETAGRWKAGIAADGGLDRLRRLAGSCERRLFTPGSDAGLPVNVLSGFDPGDLDWDRDAEVIRERISAAVSALLTRAGEDADPLQSPPHIFLANLLEDRWRAGERPGLEAILGYLLHPPFAKLGVLHVDTFYPPADRSRTMQKLNALLASPAFAAWQQGVPLELDRLLAAPAGKTPLVHFYTAHLGEEDRMMFASLLLGEVVGWMRRQSGTGSLRLLVVMDEVWGLLPPHPANPPTKAPMLTVLKQARAFGVGLVVATQNPVDLDYKALTNAGIWAVGRLSTERDKDRLLDGLDVVAGGETRSDNDAAIASLKPRQFLFRNVHEKGGARIFSTRWALSYLRGPLTREELRGLVSPEMRAAFSEAPSAGAAAPANAPAAAPATPADSAPAGGSVPGAAQAVPDGVPVYFLEPRALAPDRPGGAVAGSHPGPPKRYRAGILGRARVRFDERKAGLEHTQSEWRLIFPLTGSSGWRWPAPDAPDLTGELSPEGVTGVGFEPLPPALQERRTYDELERSLKDALYQAERMELYYAPEFKEYSRVGEARDGFETRVRRLAEDTADRDLAALRESYATKERRARDKLEKEGLDVDRAHSQAGARTGEVALDVGVTLLGMFLGGRRSTSGLTRAARGRRMAGDARARVAREESELRSAQAELDALEAQLARESERIRAGRQAQAARIETFPVTLERDDVQVEEVALLWVPDAE